MERQRRGSAWNDAGPGGSLRNGGWLGLSAQPSRGDGIAATGMHGGGAFVLTFLPGAAVHARLRIAVHC